ncbi:MAG: VIT1/CCC1 transporter family protein [Zestosphaera sp.]
MSDSLLSKVHSFLEDEELARIVYEYLASRVSDADVRRKLSDLALMEATHASFWKDFLSRRGHTPAVNVTKLRLKAALLKLTHMLFGTGFTIKLLEHDEFNAVRNYMEFINSGPLSESERLVLRMVIKDELIHESNFKKIESRFRGLLEHVREVVLGMNDGLVEVLSVSAGLSGTFTSSLYVAVGGLLVAVGGALSMGIGAYVSTKSNVQIKNEVARNVRVSAEAEPELSAEELREYLIRKGFTRELSDMIVAESLRDPRLLSSLLIESELGQSEEALEEPARAGLYTGVSYLIGSAVPLLPYIASVPPPFSTVLSLISAALVLSVTGFIISVLGGLRIRRKVVELITLGLTAAAATYTIGKMANIVLGIEI